VGALTSVVGDTNSGHVAWWNSEASDNEGRFLEPTTLYILLR